VKALDKTSLKNTYLRILAWSKQNGFISKAYSARGKVIKGDATHLVPKKIEIEIPLASNSGGNDRIFISFQSSSSIAIEFRDQMADEDHSWSGVYKYWTKHLKDTVDDVEAKLDKALEEWKRKENCEEEKIIVY
jgi:hypothetical protein